MAETGVKQSTSEDIEQYLTRLAQDIIERKAGINLTFPGPDRQYRTNLYIDYDKKTLSFDAIARKCVFLENPTQNFDLDDRQGETIIVLTGLLLLVEMGWNGVGLELGLGDWKRSAERIAPILTGERRLSEGWSEALVSLHPTRVTFNTFKCLKINAVYESLRLEPVTAALRVCYEGLSGMDAVTEARAVMCPD